jgi:type II secretory pathway component PulJ
VRTGGRGARAGFSIVELLVAALVFVIVLGATGIFFALQVQLQRDVQNRNDVQDRIRVALQLVTQDLALAGNTIRMSNAGSIESGTGFSGCFAQGTGGESCLELADVSATASTLRVRYVSSQFPLAESCRDVSYRLNGGALQRSDVACGGTVAWVDLAPSVLGFKTVVVCSNTNRYDSFPVAGCGGGASYARSALVSVAASSLGAVNAPSGPMSVVGTDPATPTTVACPAARACFDGTQEVLMPNLKDQ